MIILGNRILVRRIQINEAGNTAIIIATNLREEHTDYRFYEVVQTGNGNNPLMKEISSGNRLVTTNCGTAKAGDGLEILSIEDVLGTIEKE